MNPWILQKLEEARQIDLQRIASMQRRIHASRRRRRASRNPRAPKWFRRTMMSGLAVDLAGGQKT